MAGRRRRLPRNSGHQAGVTTGADGRIAQCFPGAPIATRQEPYNLCPMTLDPASRAEMMRTGLRRAAWLGGLVFAAVVAAWTADSGITAGMREMWSAWEAADITGYQAAWTTISIAAVVAVYWWGVGTGSRFEPPSTAALTRTDAVNTAPPQS